MADIEERAQQVNERIRRAEGFMSDADFREEVEARVIRYLQALSESVLALSAQNETIIELLSSRSEYADLSDS